MERTVGNMGYVFCMETDYDIIRLVNKNENVTNNANNIECRPSITLRWCVVYVCVNSVCATANVCRRFESDTLDFNGIDACERFKALCNPNRDPLVKLGGYCFSLV